MNLEIGRPEDIGCLNILIYGATGAGKTWICGTANECDETYPCLLVDVEGGTLTLQGQEVDIVRPKNWDDIQDIYDFLRHENDKYRSVAIDSITEVQRKLSMGTIQGELEHGGYPDLGRAVAPTKQDWLRTGEQMRKFLRAFHDLAYLEEEDRRIHVIMTALERAGDDTVCPQLPGQLGMESGAFMDVLGRLSVVRTEDEEGEEGDHRHLLTAEFTDESGRTFLAKNRGDLLGVGLWDPTIESIVGVWQDAG